MNENRVLFIEEAIIEAVKQLLASRMNELLKEVDYPIPYVEFGSCSGGDAVIPKVAIIACERTENERLALLNAYSLSVVFDVPESADSVLYTFMYYCAASKAFDENPKLGGIVDGVVIVNDRIKPPEKTNCGRNWQVVITLRLTVEGLSIQE
jgi:hypothetical protein